MTGDTIQVILGHVHDTHLPWLKFQDGDEDVNEKIASGIHSTISNNTIFIIIFVFSGHKTFIKVLLQTQQIE